MRAPQRESPDLSLQGGCRVQVVLVPDLSLHPLPHLNPPFVQPGVGRGVHCAKLRHVRQDHRLGDDLRQVRQGLPLRQEHRELPGSQRRSLGRTESARLRKSGGSHEKVMFRLGLRQRTTSALQSSTTRSAQCRARSTRFKPAAQQQWGFHFFRISSEAYSIARRRRERKRCAIVAVMLRQSTEAMPRAFKPTWTLLATSSQRPLLGSHSQF